MATITFSISKELKALMDAHPEKNWPEILRRELERQVGVFEDLVKRGVI